MNRKQQDKMQAAVNELFEVAQVIAAKHHVCRICLVQLHCYGIEALLEEGDIQHDGSEGFHPESLFQ